MFRWSAAGFALGVAFWHFVGFWDFVGRAVLPSDPLPAHRRGNLSQPLQVTSSTIAARRKTSVARNKPSPPAATRLPGDTGKGSPLRRREKLAAQQNNQIIGSGAQIQAPKTATTVEPRNVTPNKPKWAATVEETTVFPNLQFEEFPFSDPRILDP